MSKKRIKIDFHPTFAKIQTSKQIYLLNIWSNWPCENTKHTLIMYYWLHLQLCHKRTSHLEDQNFKRLLKMSTSMTNPYNAYNCINWILKMMKEMPNNKLSSPRDYLLKWNHIDIAGRSLFARYKKGGYWIMCFNIITQLPTNIPITYERKMFANFCKF